MLLLTPFASAGSPLNPIDLGKDMISDGIKNAFRSIADEIMDTICGSNTTAPNGTASYKHDAVTSLILRFATWGVTPFAYPSIQHIMGVSFVVGLG
ncbi:MAG: hypothetical protein OCU18_08480, partial [Candidatus Syntrophoarchaeum sp.]|nr:hypothetical protein [Candidatus Syntrophoarchaeum sp.]